MKIFLAVAGNLDCHDASTPLPSVVEEESGEANESDPQGKPPHHPKPPGSTTSTGVESGNGTNISEILGATPPVVSMVSKHSNGTHLGSESRCRDAQVFLNDIVSVSFQAR